MNSRDIVHERQPSSIVNEVEQYSCRTIISEKYAHLAEEAIEDARNVPLTTMLKAMIMKKHVVEDNSGLPEDALERYGRAQLQALIQASVDFCNGEGSESLKEQMATMLRCGGEKGPYLPLVIGLNSVLLEFETKDVGTLGSADHATIYAVNDNTIDWKAAPGGTHAKPDVCLLKLDSSLDTVNTNITDAGLCDISAAMENTDGLPGPKQRGDNEVKCGWSDIISCIEMRRYKEWVLRPPRLDKKYDVDSMMLTEHQASPASNPSTEMLQKEPGSSVPRGGKVVSLSATVGLADEASKTSKVNSSRKRRADSEQQVQKPNKKVRISQSNAVRIAQDAGDGKLRPDVQCAVYGIELLRSRWNRSHSIVLLLRDNLLSLRWYDSEGCIATSDVDIVEHLPLLVAVVVLMQRCKAPMHGLPTMELTTTIDGQEVAFEIPDRMPTRQWEMQGRRSATGIPVTKKRSVRDPDAPVPRANSDIGEADEDAGELADMFFKWSWREATCNSEHTIIATAKERARRYLPAEHVGDVLNHLPEIKYAQDFEVHSTAHIRKYAGIPTSCARIPNMVLFKRLEPIDGIETKVLVKKIWDVIRCSWLLWAIGVAHGDISYWNIMFDPTTEKLILNDFDLATLMEPGDESPSKKGFERTGTKPFMALALMERPNGTVKRIRTHELESFIWIFAWILEGDQSKQRWSWNHPSFRQAAQNKRVYWATCLTGTECPQSIKPDDKVFWQPLCTVRARWDAFAIAKDILPGSHVPAAPSDFMAAFDKDFPRGDEYKTWDWIAFKVAAAPRT